MRLAITNPLSDQGSGIRGPGDPVTFQIDNQPTHFHGFDAGCDSLDALEQRIRN